MVSAHFLNLGKVEFMEEGTLPPALLMLLGM
jgi:hypothetical protein